MDEAVIPLSPRQLQTVSLLANGRTLKQIALEMGVTKRTIASYLQAARRKFGAETREQLVALVVNCDLVMIEPVDVRDWS
jgi:DNA-binding CsgD family transcriptional regulator